MVKSFLGGVLPSVASPKILKKKKLGMQWAPV